MSNLKQAPIALEISCATERQSSFKLFVIVCSLSSLFFTPLDSCQRVFGELVFAVGDYSSVAREFNVRDD